jgi:hypothetical protein
MGAAGLKPDRKPDEFASSMAEAIENALWTLLQADKMNTFEVNTDSNEARDRRRILVAIAQGVIRHLVDNAGALTFTGVDSIGNPITGTVQIAFDANTLLPNPPPDQP